LFHTGFICPCETASVCPTDNLKEREDMKRFFGWMMVPAVALSLSVVPAFSAPQEEKKTEEKKKKGGKKKKDEEKKEEKK
jgi:hypothetical protein